MLAHAPGSDGDERDDGRVETVKQLRRIRQRGETVVEDSQDDHRQHRWQNETEQRKGSSSTAAQSKAHVSDGVAGARSRQTLTKRQRFDEIVLAEPASFVHDDVSYVRKDGEAAAESGYSNFEE